MKAAVLDFPGSNCDFDMYYALIDFGIDAKIIDARQSNLDDYDAIFLPGGFSYGDYLRAGAIARFAPAMEAVKKAADQGRFVVGICNGFQILTEAGLLPGALRMNAKAGFICDQVLLNVENDNSLFTKNLSRQQLLLPIAHAGGNYYADQETLTKLHANRQIIFTYQDNPNGSIDDIAGIVNEKGNVFGMMPHPERAVDPLLGNIDGRPFFESILQTSGVLN
ncbi:phosphoribosylformylglycinamidine synthase subunit PurQ [Oenococcus oeni]|uniref:Phosphoribosylformylglycinamidine synthase subunit PurQ n=1 Tax=Oenococcus oeni ATCC BAA-1163 TaxID=379360 RepID=A0NKL1_OENOE|nr:phosphoribosylformylglycinamidine synthase subunit PurQ [Oenococcus oeni]EAV38901.1 phosphoribosylformylglycinamidine synthase I [Oenococcus oeni ATCC BAA-1163]KGO16463.1 phosphoribosylformylglycinamidine synthase [Oenococcus oeni X2L]EJN98665.1 phosphoribosylformylglycinamidine synthase domain-containing protein [Oenococcus oeni AWRIB418]KDE86974.1 phosphoribosylformylglycinamidine synthase [Oenococcus oeni]KEP87466.1 phosphoribosylformylglycinamidine synthase [Oenococcus oeni IOEB_0501]